MKLYHHINYSSLLCLNLIKKKRLLLERALTYKKFARCFQILQKIKIKNKNSDIKTSKMPKNIKESKYLLSRNY